MIDFHCHLDLYPDALSMLPEVTRRNEFTLAVTTSPRAWQATSRIFAGYDTIHVALGMHPEIVAKKFNERDLLLSSIKNAGFIGEVGVDGSPQNASSLDQQQIIFREVLLESERVGGKIISIHSRNAADCVLMLLRHHCKTSIPVLHWFSGTQAELRQAIELGCWFSTGPAMLSGAKGLRLVAEMPPDRILPETDGPFAQRQSRPLMPWQAIDMASQLATLWKMDYDEVVKKMRRNLHKLLLVKNLDP